MKSKLMTAIMVFVIFGLASVLLFFGYIMYKEIVSMNTAVEVEEFVTTASSGDTIDEDIKAPSIVGNIVEGVEDIGDNSGNQNTNYNYDNITINKYFYNQLDDYSKTIYKAFESNKENMKSGTARVDFGDTFTDVLKLDNGQDLLGAYYQSAIEAYNYDNPDVFYLSPNKMYLNVETTTTRTDVKYNVFIDAGNQGSYLADGYSTQAQVNSALSQAESVRAQILNNRKSSTYENIKMVHDYLVDNISYDSSLSKSNIYNVYGALVNKECVCEGYAKSFKYLMDGLGIECVMVIGTGTSSTGATENHAWNYVKIDNKWYAVDSTWDDPVLVGGGQLTDYSKYRYFLVGSNEISKDHVPSGQFTTGGKIYTYPTIELNNY